MDDDRAASGARPGAIALSDVKPALGFAALALTIGTHALVWPLARVGVHAMPPLWFGFARMLCASIFLFVLLALLRQLRLPSRQDIPTIIALGVFMMGVFVSLSHVGMVTVGSGRAALLGYSTPLWVTPVAILFLRERLGVLKGMGLAVGLTGLAILFNPLGFDWSDRAVVTGNALLLVAALTWSACILYMRTRTYRLNTLQLAPWQLLAGSAVLLVGALVLESDRSFEWTNSNIGLIALIGPLGTSVTFWALTTTMRYLPAITSSIGFLGVPVGITITATLFFGEALTFTHIAGLSVITTGIALVVVSEAREGR